MTDAKKLQPSKRRRWMQFTLRSVLILTTLVCVGLALTYHYVLSSPYEHSAVDAIARAGGSCETIFQGPAWLRDMLGDRYFQRIVAADLSPPEATEAALPFLRHLTHLTSLSVAGARFTDDHLIAVGRLSSLRELTLRGTTVTAEKVNALREARPDLNLTTGPLAISFDDDLRFEAPTGQPSDRSHLPRRIHCLDGSAVRIRGKMYYTTQGTGIRLFVLVPPSFGPTPRYAHVLVEMKSGLTTHFTAGSITVEGKLAIEELTDPLSGEARALFKMTDASVLVPDKP
jgi:hypothetical protein